MPEIVMSQQHSSSELATDVVTEREIRRLLHEYLAQDTQPSFGREMRLRLQDPFKANRNGGFRLNALWVGLAALAALALSVFLYFNFLRL